MRRTRAWLAVLMLLTAPALAGPARTELRDLLRENYEALSEDYGQERLGEGDGARAARVSALSRWADQSRRSYGTRRLNGPWAALATSVARRLSVANDWPAHPVEISDRLWPGVTVIADRLVITRAALALTRSEDELAALLVMPLARLHAWQRDATEMKVGDRLSFRIWDEDAWLDQPERLREDALDTAATYANRLLWHAEDETTARWNDLAAGYLDKAGYRGAAVSSLRRPIERWAEIAWARGVTRPAFSAPRPDPMFESERLPADPAYLSQLDGLPMGAVEDAPLLVGNRLLVPRWGVKLLLPPQFDWIAFNDGALAQEDGQESLVLNLFEAPQKTPLDKASYFNLWPDDYRPSEFRLKGPGGVPVGLAPGYGGQSQLHSLAIGMGTSAGAGPDEPARYLHLVAWGLRPESARRRSELVNWLFTARRPLDDQDRADLAPRQIALRSWEDAAEAQADWEALDPVERVILSVLNDLPAATRLPLHQPLKHLRK